MIQNLKCDTLSDWNWTVPVSSNLHQKYQNIAAFDEMSMLNERMCVYLI